MHPARRALASVLAVGALALALSACSGGDNGRPDCALVVRYDGVRYVVPGHELLRPLPSRGARLQGARAVGCGGGAAPASTLRGVPAAQAIRYGDVVVVADPDHLPAALVPLFEPMPCATAGSFQVAGLFVDFDRADRRPAAPPYRLRLRDVRTSADADPYRGAVLTVEVAVATRPTLTTAALDRLWEASELRVRVHCESNGAFRALAVERRADRY